MTAEGIGEHGAEGLVVDIGVAVVGGAGEADVALQALLVAQRQHMHGAEVMLLVEVVQGAVVVGGGQLVVPLVAGAGEVEFVAVDGARAGKAAAGAGGHDHGFMVGRIALVDPAQLAGIERQPGDFLGVHPAPLEALRQQARVVGHQHRQLGHQGAGLEHAVGQLDLGGDAEVAVAVLGFAAFTVALQQAGAAGAAAGVELQAESTDGIHAEADGALGVTGFVAQQKALRPFLGLGLAFAATLLAEIAVHVEIAQLHAGLAVFDEGGLANGRQSEAGAQRGEGHAAGKGGLAHCYCPRLVMAARSSGPCSEGNKSLCRGGGL